MENILINNLSSCTSTELINDVIEKITLLKKESSNFDNLIKDKRIFINSETRYLFYNFLDSFYNIYIFLETDDFLRDLKDNSSENEISFWDNIINFFKFINTVETQTSFLKEMNYDEFCDLISYTFQNHIMYNDFIKQYKNWNNDQINATKKTINTFLTSMLFNFNSLDVSLYDLNIRFHFTKDKYEYIWKLCEENKIYLMLKNITERLDDYCMDNSHEDHQ